MFNLIKIFFLVSLLSKWVFCDESNNSNYNTNTSNTTSNTTSSSISASTINITESINTDVINVAVRTQRDVSKPIPIDQVGVAGISLNSVFDNQGYTADSLAELTNLLQLGTQVVLLTLYWNEFTSVWQLCPAPFPQNVTYYLNSLVNVTWNNNTYLCEYGFTTNDIMDTIFEYLQSSNTVFNVYFMHLLLNLKSIHYEKSNKTIDLENIYAPNSRTNIIGNTTLYDTVAPLSPYIFTPDVLESYQNSEANSTQSNYQQFYAQSNYTFPSLDSVLFLEVKRLLVNVVNNDLVDSRRVYSITLRDRSNIFFNNTMPSTTLDTAEADAFCDRVLNSANDIETFNNLSLYTHFRYVTDNNKKRFTMKGVRRYVKCGLSPVFNASSYQVTNDSFAQTSNQSYYPTANESLLDVEVAFEAFIPYNFWSFAPGQPIMNETTRGNVLSSDANVAYKCVAMNPDGWTVEDCYTEYQYACKNITSPNDWFISTRSRRSYFDIDNDACPDGYNFSLPRLSIEMAALYNVIKKENAEYPVWIDLNDITISTCFVSGGPYAQCPYQKTVTTKKFIRMIAPSSIVALVILFLIFLENLFRKNQLQTNRKKYWKKVLSEHYAKHEQEGVPS
ncbi:hypothetical protein LELG_02841 [Lodderomyces elongisporus NRRL YB-4239]|uniref:Maintenance of telomere capping protein 6 n=1 Tax=Lodderomyces elongisporus (strain ATCC 11503 / CBS 2605 / JCM 1781 / NBRC 1676 / NRRL YB-4239) TaxID=379508 RepID=MTC6_LODEL|nr:RecName: Full=Maintenance of telomere capping protein 6; Flags: Precursor [Lodderomyces elongisporus NRRL YB-4239]EDK44662.1 hypothetical protein LELG_02841 [Lodderomyces elongisporus NRRL YB-4239]